MRIRKKNYQPYHKELRMKGIYVLPNLFTTASLFCGFYSIIASVQNHFEQASVAILIACVFDSLDGRVARMTGTSSHFGAEYDSLSDLVAFGVAPGILAFLWGLEPFGRLGWLASFLFLSCGALRLARFNVQKEVIDPNYFNGLPIPIAAATISACILFINAVGEIAGFKHIVFIILIYMLSFLMVSTLSYPSFKNLDLRRGHKNFNLLVSVILICVLIAYKPSISFLPLVILYICSGPIITIYKINAVKKLKKESCLADASETNTDDKTEDISFL